MQSMNSPIQPEQLPHWVPGELTLDSIALDWQGMRLRGYRYNPSDVAVPPMRDYMIVVYGRGTTPMSRLCESRWRNERVHPGSVSLLTDQVSSHWRWDEQIDVTHFYLSPEQLTKVGHEVFDREVADVELMDVLRVDDARLAHMVWELRSEAAGPGMGGRLYAEAVLNQACVHILRNYVNVKFKPVGGAGRLSLRQQRQVLEYIYANIGCNIQLADIAHVAGLSVYCFARYFRASLGVPPHEYVLKVRLEYAKKLLIETHLPLKAVAAQSGFSDQSHMTRLFRARLDITPGQMRGKS